MWILTSKKSEMLYWIFMFLFLSGSFFNCIFLLFAFKYSVILYLYCNAASRFCQRASDMFLWVAVGV